MTAAPAPTDAPGLPGPPLAVRPVVAVAVVVGGLLLATSGRYGWHRDELYFVAAGRRLAWGYPDQGPLVPLLARAADVLAPGSLTAYRLPAVLAAVGVVMLSALLARDLGGRAVAQVLTAVVVGGGAITLALGHLFVTASIDVLIWTATVWLTVRVLRTGQERWWLAVGAVVGVGLLNKTLPVVLVVGLLVGALLTPAVRPRLRSGWLWAGAAVALACWAPNVAWQAAHGWPQAELASQIRAEYGTADERIGFAVLQLAMFGPAGLVLWVTGLVASLRSPRREWQPVLAWAWITVLAVFVVTAGQGYYPAAVYPPLIAAGAVVFQDRWPSRRAGAALVAAAVILTLPPLPSALPVLPAATLAGSPLAGLGENQFETVGWPEFVAQVAAAHGTVPAADRASAVVFTSNYGEAGAVELLGPAHGLPAAYSGHNAYAAWGPPPATARYAVVVSPGDPPEVFEGCVRRGAVRNAEGVPNEESTEAVIHVCPAPVAGWAAAWPRLTHLSS